MGRYLLIESRDPYDSGDAQSFCDLASELSTDGHAVTFFLVQNGVLPARPGARSAALSSLVAAGVEVLADAFSLRERGISAHRLVAGVTAAPLDIVIDHLAEGRKAIWH